jgi:hypothetical protein
MISKELYAHSPIYDIYINRETMLPYKRCNRGRKTEIQEDELVLVRLFITHNGYIKFDARISGNKNKRLLGIQYVYADAFPDRVQGWQDHLDDPFTYCELDHLNGHTTLESNFPEHLRWSSVRVNRARTSRRVDESQLDEKQLKRLYKRREYDRKRFKNPEIMAGRRKQQAEYRRRKYAEYKSQRKQETDDLNEMLASRDSEYRSKSLSTTKK